VGLRRWIVLLGVLLVLPCALPAADRGRTAALCIASLDASTADTLVEDILASALTKRLEASGISVAADRLALSAGQDAPKLPDEDRISYLLRGVDAGSANVVAAVFYLTQADTLVIQFALYDPVVHTVLGGVLTRARKGLTLFASVTAAEEEFAPSIQRYVAGGYETEPPTGIVQRITVTGPQEGARVVIMNREEGPIEGGSLVVAYTQFAIGATVPVRVYKDGYHDYEAARTLDAAEVTLRVPALERETRFDAGLDWSFGEAVGAGVGGRIHIVPDSLFLGIEGYRSLDYASLSSDLVRHYDANLQLGQYILFPNTSPFRLSIALGLGVIATDVAGLGGRDYLDWYLVAGDPTAELRLGQVSLFFRPELHYALGIDYNLLGRTWIRTPDGIPPLTVGARISW
jgi:hypothetical protein